MNANKIRMPSTLIQKVLEYKKIKTKSYIRKQHLITIKYKKFLYKEYIISIRIEELKETNISEWEEI